MSRWTSRPPVTHARAGLGAVVVGDRILAIGGMFDFVPVSFVERMRRTGQWEDVAVMPTARDNLATAVLGRRVYAIGGTTPKNVTDVVEIYDPDTDEWTAGEALPRPRDAASAAVLSGRLYVAGGAFRNRKATASMIMFEPQQGWRDVAPMATPRAQLRLVASGRHLYAIGGRAAGPSLPTVERYDPDTDSWRTLTPLDNPRAAPGVVATTIGNRQVLVVVAGAVFGAAGEFVDGRRDTEVYDVERGQWRTLDATLPRPRASFGCVVDGTGAVLAISGGTHTDGVVEFLTDVDALTFN